MPRPICEDDLHAWVDGRLSADRRTELAAWLAEDPARAERVEAWRRQDEQLHRAYDPVLDEPVPARLRVLVSRPRSSLPLRAAAVVAWMTIGAIAGAMFGYRAGLTSAPALEPLASLPQRAALAHAVYSPEVRHPVEVAADQEQHLVAWLTKRLGSPVKVPDLQARGFALLGGRLLPAADGPGAQFMYENDGGRRLTLYLNVRSDDTGTTAFRYAQQDDVGVFYWVDGRFAYALSGQFDRETLLPLATSVYQQISP